MISVLDALVDDLAIADGRCTFENHLNACLTVALAEGGELLRCGSYGYVATVGELNGFGERG